MIDPALKKGHHKLYRYDGQHFSLAVSSRRASPPPLPTPQSCPRSGVRAAPGIPRPDHRANCQPGPQPLEFDKCLGRGVCPCPWGVGPTLAPLPAPPVSL